MSYFNLPETLRKIPRGLRRLIGMIGDKILLRLPLTAISMARARLTRHTRVSRATEDSIFIDSPQAKVLTPNRPDWWVFVEIFHYEVYDRLFRLQKGDVVIDVGAHVGMFTIKAARQVGEEGLVIAIEPEPRNLMLLEQNVKGNNLSNVVIVGKAVSESPDRGKLYLGDDSYGHSLAWQTPRFVEVEIDSLDNIVSRLKLERVNFIKIDVEGMELEVLKGAEKILGRAGVKLAIAAYHRLANGEPELPRVVSHLKERGMGVHITEDNHYIYAQTQTRTEKPLTSLEGR